MPKADLERCYEEQRRCAAYLLAGRGPETTEVTGGLFDWVAEEVLILQEAEGFDD